MKNANHLWKLNKGNERFVNEYLERKQKDQQEIQKMKSAKKSGFFKKAASNSLAQSSQSWNSSETPSSIVSTPSVTYKASQSSLSILAAFLDVIEPKLSLIMPDIEN